MMDTQFGMWQYLAAVIVLVRMQVLHLLGACRQRWIEAALAIALTVVVYVMCYLLVFPKPSIYLQSAFVRGTLTAGPVGGLYIIVFVHVILLLFLAGSVTVTMHGMLTKSEYFQLMHYRVRSSHLLSILALGETVALLLFITEVILWPLTWMPYVSFLAPAGIVRLVIVRFYVYGAMMALTVGAVVMKIRLDKSEHGVALEWLIALLYYSVLILGAYRVKTELVNPTGGILVQTLATILLSGVDGKHEIAYLFVGLLFWILAGLLTYRAVAKAICT